MEDIPQPAKTITEDAEQALPIPSNFVTQQGFDPADIAERLAAWYDTRLFKIGQMTLNSVRRHQHDDA